MKIAVILPTHKNSLNKYEKLSFNLFNHYLKDFDRYLLIPNKLKINFDTQKMRITSINSKYFSSIESYNLLLQTKYFYKIYSKYDFILIYQLDCLVFKNEMYFWAKKNYSFTGAPRYKPKSIRKIRDFMNGGFSLRKVKDFINVLNSKKININIKYFHTLDYFKKPKRIKLFLKYYNKSKNKNVFNVEKFCRLAKYPEDIFWSIIAPQLSKKFTLCDKNVALNFCYEEYPREVYKYNNDQIPFGCHNWVNWDKKFWKKIVNQKTPFKI